jgi:enamine deaminase RidA (YjgF/YER057c/UK114 family)
MTVHVSDLADFAAFNAAYAEIVGDSPAARTTIGVRLRRGAHIEIEAVAYRSS